MTREEKIKDMVINIFETYGRKATDGVLQLWLIALEELTDESIAYGLNRLIKERTGDHPPTPAQFIEYTTTQKGCQNGEAEARQAFSHVWGLIGSMGPYSSPKGLNNTLVQAIGEFGGWKSICTDWTDKSRPFIEKEFIERYKSHRLYAPLNPKPLVGIIEEKNQKAIEAPAGIPKNAVDPPQIFAALCQVVGYKIAEDQKFKDERADELQARFKVHTTGRND